ncbi:hypothetical protein HPB51_004964 [Rhipicephalus microplus]|uniref:FYVE-type zinc finger domain-containing protein n=1 Tax=Rhipicephalus microplus TaxID=6941 RepID=A0A9J6EXQ2_RHIMP|nr:hypothetical protein HPB51_004964 [Rhipicephalus microplus]
MGFTPPTPRPTQSSGVPLRDIVREEFTSLTGSALVQPPASRPIPTYPQVAAVPPSDVHATLFPLPTYVPVAAAPPVTDSSREEAAMSEFAEKDKWVCPNDRELALRAKRLVDRLENMKRNALGNGTSQCVLCANEFGLLSGSPLTCYDCRKTGATSVYGQSNLERGYHVGVPDAHIVDRPRPQRAVCSKCSVDTYGAQKEQIWLCKICSETREMWKKSGAWFYRGLPNYVVPEKSETSCRYGPVRSNHNGTEATSAALVGRGWHKGTQNEKDLSDSSEDESKGARVNRRVITRKALYDSSE